MPTTGTRSTSSEPAHATASMNSPTLSQETNDAATASVTEENPLQLLRTLTLTRTQDPPVRDANGVSLPAPTYQVSLSSPTSLDTTQFLAALAEAEAEKAAERTTRGHLRTYSVDKIATADELATLISSHPLPSLTGLQWWSELRYMHLSLYRRLFILVLLANIATLVILSALDHSHIHRFTYQAAATGTGANLILGVLMRQEHVVNMIFRLVCALPRGTPLLIRRVAAKFAYSTGGIHSGCGNSALLWYVAYTILLIGQFKSTRGLEDALWAVVALTLFLFVVIIGMAHPSFRRRYHDLWELSHRYCGYSAIAAVWAQTIIIAVAQSQTTTTPIALTLITTPVFWFLIILTACLIYPWLWLRRLPIEAHQLSTHATELRFYNRTPASCRGARLSHLPLVENHGFATIPHPDGSPGYSIIVSNAGDFTSRLITSPPTHIWMRGAPTTGVMRISSLFTPIVVVATGSGIGPCLSFLNVYPNHPMRIIWSARKPLATYGLGVMRAVLRADRNAIIIDTTLTGKPDLAALTYALYRQIDAEAVAIISNPKTTQDVVYAMEARRVPAFGAIFDS